MSSGDKRLETVWECRKAGYHGALWVGDFTVVPRERLEKCTGGKRLYAVCQKHCPVHYSS